MIFSEQVEPKWKQRVSTGLRKDFQVGSEDWSDLTFTGQRIRWTKDSQSGSCIEVSQAKGLLMNLEEIPSRTKHERKSPLNPCNAYKVQKPSGTDKLGTE